MAERLKAKLPVAQMADQLGRDASTIYRGIKRNRYIDTELPELNDDYAVGAQDIYECAHAIHRKINVYLQ
nr:helix-turn-helix domain-containing protein [Phaeobacter marinintestinus]